MGRIVSNFFISLDDVVEAPDQWHTPYFDDRMGAIVGEGMSTTGAFLMGRTLYDQWSQDWTSTEADGEFRDFINAIPKYVVSSSLSEPSWHNTSVLRTADDVRAAKERTDGDITMSGSATTVRWLLAEGLLDELALLMHPIAVGSGQRLFEGTGRVPLDLVHHEVLDTGVVLLRYRPTP